MNYETLLKELDKYPDTMTDEERACAYAAGQIVDRIPMNLCGYGEPQAGLFGYTMGEYRRSAKVQLDVWTRTREEFGIGNVVAAMDLNLRGMGEALGSKVVSPENSFEYIDDHYLKDYAQLDSLEFEPETNAVIQRYVSNAKDMLELCGGKCPVVVNICGPMSTAIAIRKPEKFLRDLGKDKKNAHKLLQFGVDCNLKLLRYAKKEFGSIGVGLCDPATAATLISYRNFLEFSKPYMDKLNKGIAEVTGTMPGIHICGKTKPLWNDLIELGYPAFSVDNCEDLAELKEAVGDKMAISGNVSPADVMRLGTPDDVIESVKQCLTKCADNPCGYTLDIGCQLPMGSPRENIMAYVYAARRFGRGAQKGKLPAGLYEEGVV